MKNVFSTVIVVALVAVVGVWWYFDGRSGVPVTSFEECVEAGNPVMESYPRQCRAGGQTFVEFVGNETEKADLIRISSPRPNQTISSPLVVKGEARGSWYFEASFPVILTDWDGKIVAQGIAQAKSDWMTADFVPFEAVLTFTVDKNVYSNKGSLILRKDNPSGLPQNDDALEVPIVFASVTGTTPPPGPVACTMEAKLCPDGSAVGRTGPNCEFAACPTTSPVTVLHAAIGQRVAGLGVAITPLAVVSDSRCPADVQCVWAGTVRVKVLIQNSTGDNEVVLELGTSFTIEAKTITLKEVSPTPYAGAAVPASSYRFTFEVKK